jgi:DNA adenine methylase
MVMQTEIMEYQNDYGFTSSICYPLVKWAGGKAQILPQTSNFIPGRFRRYFEPFLGGGALHFYLISYRLNLTA